MEFACYSFDHVFCVFVLSVPILILWVIGMPLFTLSVLIANRKRLEEEKIKRYYLLLYQGLKPKVYYWEFINTMRKFLVLSLVVFLSQFSLFYQIMLSTSKF